MMFSEDPKKGKMLIGYIQHGRTQEALALIRTLAQNSPAFAVRDIQGCTALHCAAIYGRPEVVKALIPAGVKVHARDKLGRTALHWAVWNGNLDVVNALITNSPDMIHVTDKSMQTALKLAREHGRPEVVKALIAADADVAISDNHGLAALHCAETAEVGAPTSLLIALLAITSILWVIPWLVAQVMAPDWLADRWNALKEATGSQRAPVLSAPAAATTMPSLHAEPVSVPVSHTSSPLSLATVTPDKHRSASPAALTATTRANNSRTSTLVQPYRV